MPNVISVRQIGDLPLASFRFHLTMDTLALSYTLPTTRACLGLSPVRLHPCWAHDIKRLPQGSP
ncbi:CRISPR-associated protein Cas5 [Aminipila luticellarii]|uniref:CRISPR-associated protein Cas5 n=1 Tax=Aminipila luticellarii TaxID=2507160 RepID=A0A410PWF2_9FIRM|nr:CRISPR-associated protein Cas5 [Aminipila luticellarii]